MEPLLNAVFGGGSNSVCTRPVSRSSEARDGSGTFVFLGLPVPVINTIVPVMPKLFHVTGMLKAALVGDAVAEGSEIDGRVAVGAKVTT
jgi:hypothetical protein